METVAGRLQNVPAETISGYKCCLGGNGDLKQWLFHTLKGFIMPINAVWAHLDQNTFTGKEGLYQLTGKIVLPVIYR